MYRDMYCMYRDIYVCIEICTVCIEIHVQDVVSIYIQLTNIILYNLMQILCC